MIVVTTSSAKHVYRKAVKRIDFKDKEFQLILQTKAKRAVVIGSFFPPAENLLELMFLLEMFKRSKCKVDLIIPYFGYARQDRIVHPGDSFGGKVIADMISLYKPASLTIFHIHSPRLNKYIKFKNIIPLEIFKKHIQQIPNLEIVAPDLGSIDAARSFAKLLNTSFSYLTKKRPSPDKASIVKLSGNVKGKNIVMIDDMISTGGTIINAAKFLKKKGAKDIYVCATHGLFSGKMQDLNNAPIKKIFVTNTIPVKVKSRKIKVLKINHFLKKLVKGM